MSDPLAALQESVARLRGLVEPLTGEQLRARAYPSEWRIADVLSHVGSGAVIMHARLDAGFAGEQLADDFAPRVWDEWNAKSPEAKVADALVADRAIVDRFASLTNTERERVVLSLGPFEFDFDGVVGLRLNEHVLHTWDVEVARDPTATLQSDAVQFIVDNLGMIVRFGGQPIGSEAELHVRTADPARDLTLTLGADSVALTPCEDNSHAPDLELPAEAFVRLVYGRLDPAHAPPVQGDADLDALRRAFPGI
jgi:uncharacterized protein (TIGR03083 family)